MPTLPTARTSHQFALPLQVEKQLVRAKLTKQDYYRAYKAIRRNAQRRARARKLKPATADR